MYRWDLLFFLNLLVIRQKFDNRDMPAPTVASNTSNLSKRSGILQSFLLIVYPFHYHNIYTRQIFKK